MKGAGRRFGKGKPSTKIKRGGLREGGRQPLPCWLKFNIEYSATSRAIDSTGAWFAFHAKLAFASGAGNFHLWNVRREGEVMLA